jgi:hypothetical protein
MYVIEDFRHDGNSRPVGTNKTRTMDIGEPTHPCQVGNFQNPSKRVTINTTASTAGDAL